MSASPRAGRIFVYEHLTGGGLLGCPKPSGSLLREGLAMVRALAADLLQIPGVQLLSQWDERLPKSCLPGARTVRTPAEARDCFAEQACSADWTVLIAPELDGTLLELARRVNRLGGRLLGPGLRWMTFASDKHRLVQRLEAADVPAPRGIMLRNTERLPVRIACPGVLKPCDGAGSSDLRRFMSRKEFAAHWRVLAPLHPAWRIEELCPGMAASVACLCGPRGVWLLPGFAQRLSRDGRFVYRGGAGPLPARLNERAQQLAQRAIAALGPTLGFVGIDLVLGRARDGSADRVIEINPRLTTSYVGLQALCAANLSRALLAVAEGNAPQLRWRKARVEFTAAGAVRPRALPRPTG